MTAQQLFNQLKTKYLGGASLFLVDAAYDDKKIIIVP
jgi:hypothetical protein